MRITFSGSFLSDRERQQQGSVKHKAKDKETEYGSKNVCSNFNGNQSDSCCNIFLKTANVVALEEKSGGTAYHHDTSSGHREISEPNDVYTVDVYFTVKKISSKRSLRCSCGQNFTGNKQTVITIFQQGLESQYTNRSLKKENR